MTITLSCGHQSLDFPNDAIAAEWDEESYDDYLEKYVPATALATFCRKCADAGVKDGWLRPTKYDENGQYINQTKDRTTP